MKAYLRQVQVVQVQRASGHVARVVGGRGQAQGGCVVPPVAT